MTRHDAAAVSRYVNWSGCGWCVTRVRAVPEGVAVTCDVREAAEYVATWIADRYRTRVRGRTVIVYARRLRCD